MAAAETREKRQTVVRPTIVEADECWWVLGLDG